MKSEKCVSNDVDKVERKVSKITNGQPLRYEAEEDGNNEEDGKLNGLMERKKRIEDKMSESVYLFRKYLVSRSNSPSSINSTEKKRKKKWWCSWSSNGSGPPRPLFPSELGGCLSRPPSILERSLLPSLISKEDASSVDDDKGSGAQLTIFYAGLINVYDHVPLEKAQAIMHLAGVTSLSKAVIASETTPSPSPSLSPPPPPPPPPFVSPTLHCSHISSSLKPVGLPMARKYSLQCFLEKRRGRIINKSDNKL